jgi:modulator of FtsH protease
MYDNRKYGGKGQAPQQYPPYQPVAGAQAIPGYGQPGYVDGVAVEGPFEGDLAEPAVAAFAKRVYAYFASALLVAAGASAGGVAVTQHLITTENFGGLSAMRIGALVAFFGSFLFVVLTRRSHSPLKTGLLYVFATACGVMIAPMLTFFMASGMGMSIVFAFGITSTVFFGLTVYVLATGKDFSGLGKYLFAGLILAIGLILLNIFVPFPDGMSRLLMAGILILFVGYTLYDTSQVTRAYYRANDAVGAALMLFYDFFIMFKYILYFIGISRD